MLSVFKEDNDYDSIATLKKPCPCDKCQYKTIGDSCGSKFNHCAAIRYWTRDVLRTMRKILKGTDVLYRSNNDESIQ